MHDLNCMVFFHSVVYGTNLHELDHVSFFKSHFKQIHMALMQHELLDLWYAIYTCYIYNNYFHACFLLSTIGVQCFYSSAAASSTYSLQSH